MAGYIHDRPTFFLPMDAPALPGTAAVVPRGVGDPPAPSTRSLKSTYAPLPYSSASSASSSSSKARRRSIARAIAEWSSPVWNIYNRETASVHSRDVWTLMRHRADAVAATALSPTRRDGVRIHSKSLKKPPTAIILRNEAFAPSEGASGRRDAPLLGHGLGYAFGMSAFELSR